MRGRSGSCSGDQAVVGSWLLRSATTRILDVHARRCLRSGELNGCSRRAIADVVLGAPWEHRPQRTRASRARHSQHPLPADALEAEEADRRPRARLALHGAHVAPAVAGRHLAEALRVDAGREHRLDRSKRSPPEGPGLASLEQSQAQGVENSTRNRSGFSGSTGVRMGHCGNHRSPRNYVEHRTLSTIP